MSRKIGIRSGTAGDILGVEALLLAEAPNMNRPQPAYPQAFAHHKLVDFAHSGGMIVAECEGKIVGVVLLEKHGLWYTAKPHYLQAVDFCVAPEFRAGGTAAKLLERAKGIADQARVPLVVSITSGDKADLKDRFVRGMGFVYEGGNLAYIPKDALT